MSTALFQHSRSGGELIDSPGVRDYAPPPVEDAQVQVGWPEILALAPQCRFNNCLHLREPRLRRDGGGRRRNASRRGGTKATSGCVNIMRGLRARVRAAEIEESG